MHTRVLKPKRGPTFCPSAAAGGRRHRLRHVRAPRRAVAPNPVHGPKPRLTDVELDRLAQVDADHHVLVAYVEGDGRRWRSRGWSGMGTAPRSPSRWRRLPAARDRLRVDRRAAGRRARSRDHAGRRPRDERQPGSGGAATPDRRGARDPLRGASARDPGAPRHRLTPRGPPVRRPVREPRSRRVSAGRRGHSPARRRRAGSATTRSRPLPHETRSRTPSRTLSTSSPVRP